MKKCLLAVAAVVGSIAATAHARPVDAMLGRWCLINDGRVYTRTKRTDITRCVTVEQKLLYWDDPPRVCEIDKKIRMGRDTYVLHTSCEYRTPFGDEPSYIESEVFQFKLICKKTCNLSIKHI